LLVMFSRPVLHIEDQIMKGSARDLKDKDLGARSDDAKGPAS